MSLPCGLCHCGLVAAHDGDAREASGGIGMSPHILRRSNTQSDGSPTRERSATSFNARWMTRKQSAALCGSSNKTSAWPNRIWLG